VFGHDDVADDAECVLEAAGFEDCLEEELCGWGCEVGIAAVAGKGDEVEVAGLLATFEPWGHGGSVRLMVEGVTPWSTR
jgi:hypothetical protein